MFCFLSGVFCSVLGLLIVWDQNPLAFLLFICSLILFSMYLLLDFIFFCSYLHSCSLVLVFSLYFLLGIYYTYGMLSIL